MTIRDWLALVAFAGAAASLAAPLLSYMFCVRPVPASIRQWRDVALAIGFARLVNAGLSDTPLPLDMVGVVVWGHLALAQCAVAAANWWGAARSGGDRCGSVRES